jgi:hypothetical protein
MVSAEGIGALMPNEIYTVEVEWMDGEKRSYTVGGYVTGYTVDAGILHLIMGNNACGRGELLAAIPLANVRTYRRVER